MNVRALYLLVLLFISVACDSANPEEPTPPVSEGEISILPLGDSRVEGARPAFESYRYELWKNLVAQNYDIDFVGPEVDNANYPPFMNQTFDNDHAGIGGDQTSNVLERLDEVLSASPEPPEFVLLGIGGNDLLDGVSIDDAISNINAIIDRLQTNNPNVTILIEQIAPGQSELMATALSTVFAQFNQQIPIVANQQSNSTSSVIVVDMSSDWSDAFLADEVHYNEAGAKEVADRYFTAIESALQ